MSRSSFKVQVTKDNFGRPEYEISRVDNSTGLSFIFSHQRNGSYTKYDADLLQNLLAKVYRAGCEDTKAEIRCLLGVKE